MICATRVGRLPLGEEHAIIELKARRLLSDVDVDPSSREYGGDRERKMSGLHGSFSASAEAEAGISFIITKAQKAELRRRGYSEEQIREMKPEDAHRALCLISP
jgi:hypothetical protein